MIRIDHVNVVVQDVERSVRFYQELLGLRRGFERILEGTWVETVTGLTGARAHCVFMETDDPNVRVELLQYLSPEGAALPGADVPNSRGLRHFGLVVESIAALESLASRLRAAGVPVFSDPVVVPFAVSNLGRKRLFYFHDPDGTILEAAAYG